MKALIAAVAAIGIGAAAWGGSQLASPTKAIEWEHGWKTDYVVATRYKNPYMGYNIGFDLPKNPYDADRAEMFDWLDKRGVHIFQGGGAPGATNYAKIDGVTNRETADQFLAKFLPEFDAWVRANLR